MAAQRIKKFIDNLNQFHQHVYKPWDALSKLIQSADTGVPALDQIFKNAQIHTWGYDSTGYNTLNLIDITTIVELIRGADIVELNARMKSNVNVTANDITLLREAVGFTPQRALFDLEREIKTNYQKYKDLNVTVETYDRLSESAREEILRIENCLIEKMPNTIKHLTIGSITVKPGWILDATKRRSGCQMLTTIQEKTTSCKIIKFSCNKSVINNDANDNCPAPNNLYSTILISMYIAHLADNDPLKIGFINSVTSKNLPLYADHLKTNLINVVGYYGYLFNSYIDALKKKPQFDICTIKQNNVENGEIPFCRMCDPMVRPNSTKYIDSTMYNNNITFKCVQKPSIIDVITDASLATGINLFETCNQPEPEPEPEVEPEPEPEPELEPEPEPEIPTDQPTQNGDDANTTNETENNKFHNSNSNNANYLLILIVFIIAILLILLILFFRRNKNENDQNV